MIDQTRREVFNCPDCTTPSQTFVVLPGYLDDGGDGGMQIVTHDPTCPRLARMSEGERREAVPGGLVLHLADDAPGSHPRPDTESPTEGA